MKIRRMIVDEVDVDEFDVVDDACLELAKMTRIHLLPIRQNIFFEYTTNVSLCLRKIHPRHQNTKNRML